MDSPSATFITNGVTAGDILVISSGTQQGRYLISTVNTETRITTNTTFNNESPLNYSIGRTLLYRVNVGTGLIAKENKTAYDHIRAPTVYWNWGSNIGLYAGDYYGRLQGVSPFSANLDNLAGFPVSRTETATISITAMATVMYLYTDTRILYGDMGGWFYVCNMDGTSYDPDGGGPLLPYPFQPGGAVAIESSPMPDYAGLIFVGNNDGKVFVINEASRSVSRTYSFGTGIKIGDIGYDADNGRFLVPTSTGKVYYLSP
ncbi:MAG: hypothetical protein HY762_06505 [Planctomycetes bacterium]|nr:hypothetical protein [Planctomycetota bacterium]